MRGGLTTEKTKQDQRERERHLDAIIDEYYCSAAKGEAPDQTVSIFRHPDFKRELNEFFADLGLFQYSGRSNNGDPHPEPAIMDSTSQGRNFRSIRNFRGIAKLGG